MTHWLFWAALGISLCISSFTFFYFTFGLIHTFNVDHKNCKIYESWRTFSPDITVATSSFWTSWLSSMSVKHRVKSKYTWKCWYPVCWQLSKTIQLVTNTVWLCFVFTSFPTRVWWYHGPGVQPSPGEAKPPLAQPTPESLTSWLRTPV